jgi:signal transduction histidine kinase
VGALLPARPAEASASADAIGATARQAMTELRRLLGVLRFNSAEQELSPERTRLTPAPSMSRLDELLALVRASGLPVRCTVSGSPASLPPGVDLTAYRIVQEALTNARRHAPGAAAAVAVAYEDGYLSVAVTNTAPPPFAAVSNPPMTQAPPLVPKPSMTPTAAASKASTTSPISSAPQNAMAPSIPHLAGGYGLAGIAERVASCGGSLTLGPAPDGGFTVTARLPLT